MVIIETGFTGSVYPLDHPRVGWRRLSGAVTASSAADGYAAGNANGPETYTFWRPTAAGANWTLTGSGIVSYVGIAAHNLGTVGATVAVQTDTGSGFEAVPGSQVSPADDEPLLFLFEPREAEAVRVVLSGAVATIGVIYAGEVTEWPRKATYAPSVSMHRAKQTEFRNNVSETGQWLGRSKARQSLAPQMQVANLSETWIADEFDAFAAHAEDAPFFIADRPGQYPESVAYAWSGGDLIPERGQPNRRIANSVSLDLTGFRA